MWREYLLGAALGLAIIVVMVTLHLIIVSNYLS